MSVAAEDKIELIRRVPLFSELDTDELAKLARIAVIRKYPRNSTIFHEGDYADALYLLRSGRVKIQLTDISGKEVIVSVLESGESFGEMALIDSHERCAQVVTMSTCELIQISSSEFKRLLSDSPDLSLVLLRQMANRLRQANRNIGTLASLDVLGRVARLLLEYAIDEEGQLIVKDLPTQREIASMVGASREMVNRVFKHLTSRGYVESRNGQLIIQDGLESALTA